MAPNVPAGVTADGNMRRSPSAHVLMIPFSMQSHILPTLDLAYKLTSSGDITVTFVCFQVFIDRLEVTRESKRGSSSNDAVHLVGVPDDLPGFNPPSELSTYPKILTESLQLGHNLEPFVNKLLQDRERLGLQGPTCLLSDFVHWWTIDVASRLSIPRYALAITAPCHSLTLLSAGESGWTDEEISAGIHIPGLPPLDRSHIPLSALKSAKEFLIRWPKSLTENDGLLLNTCLALDAPVVDALRSELPNKPLFPVGPLGMSFSKNVSTEGLQLSDQTEVASWLDQQPALSVLYIAFGTTGLLNLGKRHLLELATALEASQQRFVWALRAPSDVQDGADFLPLGFEERVKGRGLFLRGWAPQLQILAHPSTGGLLGACGWNSVIESLSLGVPMIGWPSFADQEVICRYMEAVFKVVIELPRQAGNFVEAEEIQKAIMLVLQSGEGRAMRERAAKFKTSIPAAVAPGGSSSRAIEEFADLLRRWPSAT